MSGNVINKIIISVPLSPISIPISLIAFSVLTAVSEMCLVRERCLQCSCESGNEKVVVGV